MDGSSFSHLPPQKAEREALCDLLLEVGPHAPTLCEGWDTTDLAVHLVVRERKPQASPGILLGGPFRRVLERTSIRLKEQKSFEDLVATIRSGPPLPMRLVDSLVNTQEMFIHLEDVRRGGGDNTPRPQAEIKEVEDALWTNLRRAAWLLVRRLGPVGVDLVGPDGRVIHARRGAGKLVTVTGRAGEIALYLTGRKTAANVELSGPDEAVAALRAAPLGI